MSKSNFRIQTVRFLAAFSFVAFFSACGDDNKPSSNGGDESAVKQVNRVDDLGGCNKNKFGEIIYVAETDSLYECTGSGWVATDSSAIEGLLSGSSSSESDEDDSSDSKSSSSFKTDSSDVADVETVKVDSVTLKGFAQKGPFASGTAVSVFGLDSLLEKTKTKFTGKVAGDSGAFKVENIAFPSQFALVEVSGFFKNEISGKNTTGTKTTLTAIVDLSEGKSVKANVNLFTTLEHARVKYLVAKEGFNVPAAKKRASAELLSIFGARGEDLTATSISLDTSAAGEALLTASVMLLGDLSASKFGSRLSDVADIFAESGLLADEDLLVNIADWASKVDSTDNFESIRKNVKEMKLFETVPDFDDYLYKFWTLEYKLFVCTDSLEETIKKNENKKSDNYGAGYVCTSNRWHKATALDTDLGLCTAKREGDFEERKAGKETEYYVCKSGTWNKIDETAYELKLCTEARHLELVETKKSGSYVCEWDGKDGEWREASDIEAELGVCGGKNVKVDTIYKTKTDEYYECRDKNWEKTSRVLYLYGKCTSKLQDTVVWTGDFYKDMGLGNIPVLEGSSEGEFYRCNNEEWQKSDNIHYFYGATCDKAMSKKMDLGWESEDGVFDIRKDNFLLERFWGTQSSLNEEENKAYEDMFTVDGKVYSYALCQDDEWINISAADFSMRRLCVDSLEGYKGLAKSTSGAYVMDGYFCTKQGWQKALVDDRDTTIYRIVEIGSQTWMAENLNYDYDRSDMKTLCPEGKAENCEKLGRLYSWPAIFDSLGLFSTSSKYCGAIAGSPICVITDKTARGVCPKGYHIPDTSETGSLFRYAGANDDGLSLYAVAGKKLRSKTGWDIAGTDDFGFSALSVGDYLGKTYYPTAHSFATWRRNADDPDRVYYAKMIFDKFGEGYEFIPYYDNSMTFDKMEYIPVRCIKD